MNSVSAALIPKVYSVGHSDNPLTQAALIAAGMVSGDLSNSAVQDAIASVSRYAASSENPEAWIAAFLADMAVNGVPGSGSASGVLTSLMRIAPSSENPAVWIAAFLSDMAANGLPGGGGTPEPEPEIVSFTDTFDRADANPMTNPVSGGTWTDGPGGLNGCQIVNTSWLQGTSSYSGARVLTPVFPSDHRAAITVAATGGFFGPCVRLQSPTNASGYVAGINAATTLYVYKITQSADPLAGGDFAQLGATVAVTPIVGDVIALEAVGSTLNVYINDVLIATRTDATYTGGQPGVFLISSAVVGAFNSIGGSGGGGGALTLGDMTIGSTFTVS